MCEDKSVTFTLPLKQLVRSRALRVLRLMNCTNDLFEQGFTISKTRLRRTNASVLNRLMARPHLHVSSRGGTDLSVDLSPQFEWISNYGHSTGSQLTVLPPGEVNTYPAMVTGTFVADGALHANIPIPFDVRLRDDPVHFEIRDSEVQSIGCDDQTKLSWLQNIFSEPLARRIGEFGIGTNTGISEFVHDNSHLNERYPGVHLGFGEHAQRNVAYVAPYHIDAIAKSLCIRDGREGTILLETDRLPTDIARHPRTMRSEDLEICLEVDAARSLVDTRF